MYRIKILKCLEPSGSNIRPTDSQVPIEKQTNKQGADGLVICKDGR